jgi:hypothetical protein
MYPYTCIASPSAPNWWPNKLPGATLDYSLDISAAINPEIDIISTVTAACAPSGSGEMVLSNLYAATDVLTLTCSGGVPTRVYSILFTVTMYDGRIFDFLVYQGIPPALRGYPIPVPPSPGFGPPITWNNTTAFFGISPLFLGGF